MVPGEFEQVVLLAALRLGDVAYGVSIREEIAKRTGRQVAPGRSIRRSTAWKRRAGSTPVWATPHRNAGGAPSATIA